MKTNSWILPVLAVLAVGLVGQWTWIFLSRPPVVARVSLGDTLAPTQAVKFRSRGETAEGRRDGIGDQSGCIALVFYSSECPACRRLAPSYAEQAELEAAGIVMPLYWVSSEDDGGAAAFTAEHRIESELVIAKRAFASLGIQRVPTMYVVAPGAVLLASFHPRKEIVAASLDSIRPLLEKQCAPSHIIS